jgi:nicotinamide mononucleotide transporter
LAIGSALVATGVNGWLLAPAGDGAVPYVDALVAWVSVLATWMVARKVLENWLYWVVIDLVAAGLYWTQGFHATTALYLVYVVVAARGFLVWRADVVVARAGRAGVTSA